MLLKRGSLILPLDFRCILHLISQWYVAEWHHLSKQYVNCCHAHHGSCQDGITAMGDPHPPVIPPSLVIIIFRWRVIIAISAMKEIIRISCMKEIVSI